MKKRVWIAVAVVLLAIGLAGLLALSAQSCLKSYVEYFDDSSASRLSTYLSDLDAMLGGVYVRDMETRDGRRRWHGDCVSRFETNTETRIIQRVDVYADGYEWVCPAKERWYTPEEQAEREARRKSGRTLEERIAALRAQIEALVAEKASMNNELEIAYAVIQIAQKRKTLERLEASQTNVVNIVVSPEVN